jgi:hypothetical protein
VEVDRAIAVLRERAVAMIGCRQQKKLQALDVTFENTLLAITNLPVSIKNTIVTACESCPACKQPEVKAE